MIPGRLAIAVAGAALLLCKDATAAPFVTAVRKRPNITEERSHVVVTQVGPVFHLAKSMIPDGSRDVGHGSRRTFFQRQPTLMTAATAHRLKQHGASKGGSELKAGFSISGRGKILRVI